MRCCSGKGASSPLFSSFSCFFLKSNSCNAFGAEHRYISASPLAKDQLLLTKGDNNPVDDIDLYQGLEWLERKHIVGKVRA